MTLTVEDGTIVSGANSYVTLDNAETYWGDWGYSLAGIDSTQQTNALILACYAMEKLFGRFYIGRVQRSSPQALLWPRQFSAHQGYSVQVQDTTGSGAQFILRIIDGSIANVFILNGGTGYTAPTLTIQGPISAYATNTSPATLTASLTSGAISSVTITNAGQNYWTPGELIANDYTTIQINEIPQALQDAQCEIAWMYLNDENIFPQLSDEQKAKQVREQLGTLNFITTYDTATERGDGERLQGFRKVELILEPIIVGQHYVL